MHYLINHVVEGARAGDQVSKKVSHIYIYTLRLGYSEILFQIKKLYSEENDTLCIILTNTTKCLNFIEESKSTAAYEFAQFSIT